MCLSQNWINSMGIDKDAAGGAFAAPIILVGAACSIDNLEENACVHYILVTDMLKDEV